jgi:hypothetical protein
VHALFRSFSLSSLLLVALVSTVWSQTSPSPSAAPPKAPSTAPSSSPKSSTAGANSNQTGTKQPQASKPGQTTNKDGTVKEAPKPRSNVAPAASKKNTLTLTPLLAADWQRGCGCRFYKPTDQKENGPLLLRLSDKKQGKIRSEGKLETLELIDEKHIQKKPPAILAKDRMMLKFKGNNITASFSGSAEKNCPKFQDACKAVSYQGVLTLSQMGKQGSFPAWGLCGC